jgi:glycosyltransferase involved in cell wall biosynthesis
MAQRDPSAVHIGRLTDVRILHAVLISVAMATHDAERFIDPLLESLAQQSRPPHELVVCDDASEDGTLARLDAFSQRAPFDVHVHASAEWRGHVPSFLDAARRCTGDVVAFCDADDIWRPDKLEVCGEALERSGASLVMHTTAVVDEELRDLGIRWPAIEATELAPALRLTGLDIDAPGMGWSSAATCSTRPTSTTAHPHATATDG